MNLRDELIDRATARLVTQNPATKGPRRSAGVVIDSLNIVALVEALEQATLELREASKIIGNTHFEGTASLFSDAAARHRETLTAIGRGK